MRIHLRSHTHTHRRKGMGTCFQTVILTRDFYFFPKNFATVSSILFSTARGTGRETRERERRERERREGGGREERREKREEGGEKREER